MGGVFVSMYFASTGGFGSLNGWKQYQNPPAKCVEFVLPPVGAASISKTIDCGTSLDAKTIEEAPSFYVAPSFSEILAGPLPKKSLCGHVIRRAT